MDEPVAQGRSFPLGSSLRDGGANFSVFSKHSTGVELCLFDQVDDARPVARDRARSTHLIAPITTGMYLYPASRPANFMHSASMVRSTRPTACASTPARRYSIPMENASHDPIGYSRRGGLPARRQYRHGIQECRGRSWHAYDSEGDRDRSRPFERTVIYETHVGRLHAASGLRRRPRGARHFHWPDPQDSLFAGSWHDRGGAAAGVRSSTNRTRRPGSSTTGATSPSPFSHRIPAIARVRLPPKSSTIFATW